MTSGKFATTIGYEKRFNPAFLYEDREEFIAFMTHGQPSRPANMDGIVAINQGRRPLAAELPSPPALSLGEADAQIARGALWLDVREIDVFGAGHIPGAYNIQLSSDQFEQRVGWVLPEGAPVLLLLEEDGDIKTALYKLAFVGLEDRVAGYLRGGIRTWLQAGREVVELPQIAPQDLQRVLGEQTEGMQVLDVREPDEWEGGHIRGSVQMSYKDLPAGMDALGLDPEAPVYVTCAGGFRSSTACSLLLRRGFRHVTNLSGGMDAWKAAGLPVDGEDHG